MAVEEVNLSFYTPDDTTFRAYITMLITQFTAMGLVQTADTGQINPASVNVMSAVNQDRGYLMFRFNDTLQSTKPVFIKITIGSIISGDAISGGQIYFIVRLVIQIATSTDGAGNLGARKSKAHAISYRCNSGIVTNTSAAVAAADLHLFCGDNNRILMLRGANSPTAESWTNSSQSAASSFIRHGYFSVERSKNDAGEDTDDGIIFCAGGSMWETASNTFGYHLEYIPFTRQLPPRQEGTWNTSFIGMASNITARSEGKLSTFPFYPIEGGKQHNAGINQLGFISGEFGWFGEPVAVNCYGTQRLYRPINDDLFRVFFSIHSTVVQAGRMMILWE